MTTTTFLSVLCLSTAIAGGAALAQSDGDNPNRQIERQIEAQTQSGMPQPDGNTLGEATAATQSGEPEPPVAGTRTDWVGKPVAAIDGTEVGTVSQVMTDETGAVMEVRARIGGLFGLFTREVSIPAARIVMERSGTLVAEMSVEEIKNAPTVRG